MAEIRGESLFDIWRLVISKSCLLLYRQDASWELTSDLGLRFSTPKGNSALKCPDLNGLDVQDNLGDIHGEANFGQTILAGNHLRRGTVH